MKGYREKNNRREAGAAVIMAGLGIFLSLFNRWEMSGESWGYWLFSRVFSESGRFAIFDRSPLYALYLNVFRWLGYPASVTAEYITTSAIVILALVILFRPYLGLWFASFAAVLWIPFLQTAEPPVQKLALACSCFAVASRGLREARMRFVVSYTLLGLAAMFRSTYVIFIVIFAAWDTRLFFMQKKVKVSAAMLRPRLNDWPLLLLAALLVYFLTMQSNHRWNNAYFCSAKWFPGKSSNLTQAAFLQHYNWRHIKDKYGTYEGKDFYFTNREIFGEADTLFAMIKANPPVIISQVLTNIKSLIPIAADTTGFYKVFLRLKEVPFLKLISTGWLCLILVAVILNGAFRAVKESRITLFILGNIFVIGTTVFIMPKERYMLPFIPVLTLSAFWHGLNLLKKNNAKIAGRGFSYIVMPLLFILFSNGASGWIKTARSLTQGLRKNDFRILEALDFSMKASYKALEARVRGCNGVMAEEHAFIAAFMPIPLARVYDIWEIPPFGCLGDPPYNGLSPERIDCLLISHTLAADVGQATNSRIRYKNYIRPYAKRLLAMGGEDYRIGGFGEAVTIGRKQ